MLMSMQIHLGSQPASLSAILILVGALAMPLVSCTQTPDSRAIEFSDDQKAIRKTLAKLYKAFCFDPDAEPDWDVQRSAYLQGAAFVAPIRSDQTPCAVDTDTFIEDFRRYATSDPYRSQGFHERITGTSVRVLGDIAHALVAFEGFVPSKQLAARPEEASTVGVDSIQFVRDGESWRLVSFTTQYEREGFAIDHQDFDEWQ
ncbi:MAG: hypothetical protein ACI841_004701 [Planctomycetota bacterium]|jgi:hypothetical protein